MNVKELLMSCDIQQAALMHYGIQWPPYWEDWGSFFHAHQSFIQEIATIEPVAGDYVILGSTNYNDCEDPHSVHMYCKTELPAEFQPCSYLDLDRRAEDYSDEEIAQIADEVLRYRFPDSHDMESMFWEELLGVEVFDGNMCAVGRDVLAALVIREMSFWGMSYEKTKQAQQRFWRNLEEAEKELVNEQNCFETVAELMAELAQGDDLEPIQDEAPREEESVRIAFPEKSREVQVRNNIAQYREILRYIERKVVDNDTPS
jgi:hypothetical protein